MGLLDQLIGRESPALLALDISSTRIKLLELTGSPGDYRIEAYASEALPPESVSAGEIAEPEAVGQAIARAVKRAGTRQKNVAVAVSGSSVISKIIDVPATLSEDEIEQQIGFEADQYIPYPIEEVSLDFQILGPSEHDPEMNQVLLAACRRDTVDQRIGALQIAGLTARVVDVEAYALQNACQLLTPQMPDAGAGAVVAVVDFGAQNTAVNVLADNETIYTRDQSFGGAQFVDEIQRHYELDHDQALAKLRDDDLDKEFLAQAVPAFAEQMAQQINRSLQFFFSASTRHDAVDQVVLVGGCALLPGIGDLVAQSLDIPTVVGNPLDGMSASANAKRNRVQNQGPALMTAAGLALRAFQQ